MPFSIMQTIEKPQQAHSRQSSAISIHRPASQRSLGFSTSMSSRPQQTWAPTGFIEVQHPQASSVPPAFDAHLLGFDIEQTVTASQVTDYHSVQSQPPHLFGTQLSPVHATADPSFSRSWPSDQGQVHPPESPQDPSGQQSYHPWFLHKNDYQSRAGMVQPSNAATVQGGQPAEHAIRGFNTPATLSAVSPMQPQSTPSRPQRKREPRAHSALRKSAISSLSPIASTRPLPPRGSQAPAKSSRSGRNATASQPHGQFRHFSPSLQPSQPTYVFFCQPLPLEGEAGSAVGQQPANGQSASRCRGKEKLQSSGTEYNGEPTKKPLQTDGTEHTTYTASSWPKDQKSSEPEGRVQEIGQTASPIIPSSTLPLGQEGLPIGAGYNEKNHLTEKQTISVEKMEEIYQSLEAGQARHNQQSQMQDRISSSTPPQMSSSSQTPISAVACCESAMADDSSSHPIPSMPLSSTVQSFLPEEVPPLDPPVGDPQPSRPVVASGAVEDVQPAFDQQIRVNRSDQEITTSSGPDLNQDIGSGGYTVPYTGTSQLETYPVADPATWVSQFLGHTNTTAVSLSSYHGQQTSLGYDNQRLYAQQPRFDTSAELGLAMQHPAMYGGIMAEVNMSANKGGEGRWGPVNEKSTSQSTEYPSQVNPMVNDSPFTVNPIDLQMGSGGQGCNLESQDIAANGWNFSQPMNFSMYPPS